MTKTILNRVRVTAATKRRSANMLKLVDRLRSVGEMSTKDMDEFLQFSPSGTRKYLKELRAAEILKLSRFEDGARGYTGTAYFKLTSNETLLATFVKEMEDCSGNVGTERPAPAVRTRKLGDRTVHIVADTVLYRVQLPSTAIPQPDPVLSAFFGMSSKTVKNA